ncbi:MAG: universal stress protein [Thermoanaerobaculia bacterium]
MSTVETVLCPIDFSDLSERTLRLAVELCRRTGAKLVLEHNLESRPPAYLGVGWMWSEEHEAEEHDKGELAVRRLQEVFKEIPEGIEYEAKITRGPIDESLLHLAKILPAGLIVMGTHGPSSPEHQSLTEKIIIRAPCTVLTVGESYRPESVFGVGKERPEHMSMLVPYDFSSRARACLETAIAMAQRMPHRIHLLHVVQPKSSLAGEPERSLGVETLRSKLAALIPDQLADRMTVDVAVGEPVRQILDTARSLGALFILMPAHGKSPLKRFLFGTTTLGVLHGSDCPVWFMSSAARRHPPEWAAA